MFKINTETGAITMHKGDTGSFLIRGKKATFGAADRAVFTVRDSSGTIVKEQTSALADGAFRVIFLNSDTDGLATGTYKWDVRYAWNPVYDDDNKVIDGYPIYTPRDGMTLEIRPVVGEI